MKEVVLDPIRRFMSGANKNIYDEASRFLQEQKANFAAIGDGKPDQLRIILSDPYCFKGNQMREVKILVDSLKVEVEQQLKVEKENALERVNELHLRLQVMNEYSDLTNEQKQEIDGSFEGIEYQLREQTLIPVVRDGVGRYETVEYNRLLTNVTTWTQDDGEEIIGYVSQSELDVKYAKPYIANEEDVAGYLDALKKAMLKAIKTNKRIRL